MDLAIARANLIALGQNTYPGRGIVVGMDRNRWYFYLIGWIMARSIPNRNRAYRREGSKVITAVAEASKPVGLPLAYYTAMDTARGVHIVTNGSHTDLLIRTFERGRRFADAFEEFEYEDDPPVHTSRIAAVCRPTQDPTFLLGIARKAVGSSACEREFFSREAVPGLGYCLTTYLYNDEPPPPFRGEPILLPLEGDVERIAKTIWDALSPEYRIDLVIKRVAVHSDYTETHIVSEGKLLI
jgi:IMP cyclohydrolase